MRKKLLDLCLGAYNKVMMDRSDVITDADEAKLIADPLKYQMWHHTFDPNTDVP